MSVETERVLAELREERERQRDAHGMDEATDDARPLSHFAYLLTRRAAELGHPWPDAAGVDVRRILVEIASIAVAAVESWDRRHG